MDRALQLYLHKAPIDNCPEALRLFMLCEATNWSHLPVQGGLYDQDPAFLETVKNIFQARSIHEKQEADRNSRSKTVTTF